MLNLLLWMQCDLKNWVSWHFQHCSYCSELPLTICGPPCFHIIVSFGSVNNVGQTLKKFVRDEKDKDREEEEKVGVHEVCFFRKCEALELKGDSKLMLLHFEFRMRLWGDWGHTMEFKMSTLLLVAVRLDQSHQQVGSCWQSTHVYTLENPTVFLSLLNSNGRDGDGAQSLFHRAS